MTRVVGWVVGMAAGSLALALTSFGAAGQVLDDAGPLPCNALCRAYLGDYAPEEPDALAVSAVVGEIAPAAPPAPVRRAGSTRVRLQRVALLPPRRPAPLPPERPEVGGVVSAPSHQPEVGLVALPMPPAPALPDLPSPAPPEAVAVEGSAVIAVPPVEMPPPETVPVASVTIEAPPAVPRAVVAPERPESAKALPGSDSDASGLLE